MAGEGHVIEVLLEHGVRWDIHRADNATDSGGALDDDSLSHLNTRSYN